MGLSLAARAGLIAPSATLAMAAEAKRLQAAGVQVLDFADAAPANRNAAAASQSRAMRRGRKFMRSDLARAVAGTFLSAWRSEGKE